MEGHGTLPVAMSILERTALESQVGQSKVKKERVDGLSRLKNGLETLVRWTLSLIRSGGISHCTELAGQG